MEYRRQTQRDVQQEDSGKIAGNFESLFTHDHSENYVRSEAELSSN